MSKKNYAMRYVAGLPVKKIFQTSHSPHKQGMPLTAFLRVMVWNIFKQQRGNWLSILRDFGAGAQLILLQEAQTTPEMLHFATANYLATDQVPALKLTEHPSGVMTLSAVYPIYCCPLRVKEPFLRLSKSALITIYMLQNGESLMVVNIHAVNFSLGIYIYSKQLKAIGKQISPHIGPIILAGDFNAWSYKRLQALYQFTEALSLHEVKFPVDNRRLVFGRPLDFIFFRGFQVMEAVVLVTDASDHNPLRVDLFNL